MNLSIGRAKINSKIFFVIYKTVKQLFSKRKTRTKLLKKQMYVTIIVSIASSKALHGQSFYCLRPSASMPTLSISVCVHVLFINVHEQYKLNKTFV